VHQQHRNEGRPNLDPHRIGARAHEGLDPELLLEALEKQFDLPAFCRLSLRNQF
jgi:hypothetical protein